MMVLEVKSSQYRFFKVSNDMESLFLKGIKSHFINKVVDSEETYLHIIWKLIHCIDLPSEVTQKNERVIF